MAVDLTRIGERTLLLDCDVLQADGGTRVASVTGGYLALALGLTPLIQSGEVPPEALKPPIAGVSVGVVHGQPLLDLDYQEDSQADVDMNIVMTARGEFIEVQGTGESRPFSKYTLNQLLNLAEKGVQEILNQQSEILKP
jgi:ribonuclease PH